jgi:predicted metal-dependent phosphoesterase TrpH
MEKLINRKTVFHLHTKYSYDSFLKPETIVDTLVKANIDNVIITDHNSILGAQEAKRYAEENHNGKINVIIGEEVNTDIGDIIGFPLKEEIQDFDHLIVIDKIKKQGGFVCIPHPYKYHNLFRIHESKFLNEIDFVEVFNSRLTDKFNGFAQELADSLSNKKEIIGTDAHLKKDLLNTFFIYDENMKFKERLTNYTSKRNYWLSQTIKNIKKKNLLGIIKGLLLAILNKF